MSNATTDNDGGVVHCLLFAVFSANFGFTALNCFFEAKRDRKEKR
jgi:hypothetical protein